MVERLSAFRGWSSGLMGPSAPHRKGQYRLARTAEQSGADIQLCYLLDRIALDCPRKSLPWERPQASMIPCARPGSPILMRRFTVIQGGKG
jgi:hypothetical protein